MNLKRGSLTLALVFNYCVAYFLQVNDGQKCINLEVKIMRLLLRYTSEMIVNMVAFNEKTMEKFDGNEK